MAQAQVEMTSVELLHGRAGSVQGESRDSRCPGQGPSPELRVRLQVPTLQPGLLPRRVVGVLDAQGAERRVGTIRPGARVVRVDLAEEDLVGPAVEGDVVLADDQQPLLGTDVDQVHADRQVVLEVVGRPRQLAGEHQRGLAAFLPRGAGVAAVAADPQVPLGERALDGLLAPLRHLDDAAQHLVAGDDPGEGVFEKVRIEGTGEPRRDHGVVRR